MNKPFLNKEVIDRWRHDLLSNDGPKFNMDFEILEHEGRQDDPKRFEGDPGLFLAYTYADIDDDSQLSAWMADKSSETLITVWTGIPRDKAEQLINPKHLWQIGYPTRTITAKQFVEVLDIYLETGNVLWEKVALDNPKFTPEL